ncbi:wax ester/triacylglycerol synthase domain-containing protein [Kribbella qitaiheensis]|uniref:wax ester/triacylglycerol synthase domain-containing protein n=1 Tax=Kribbella qitaiheensis TaxID=1544730 RepID=UPI002484339A|nr:wax ester/triacylglycerol synthase domain-containing protein [Kribbella qitaiheensis]
MPDRLTSLDLTFLKTESPATPMHVGTVDIFEPPVHGDDGFDYESLVALIRDRIAFVPRYRQRIQQIPGRFAGPIWVDDEDFDITFHVRRSALPRPGTHAQLLELVARIMSRRLDRARAAVGDVSGRGSAGRPVRDHREVPSGACRRQQHGRHRPGGPGRDRAPPRHPD